MKLTGWENTENRNVSLYSVTSGTFILVRGERCWCDIDTDEGRLHDAADGCCDCRGTVQHAVRRLIRLTQKPQPKIKQMNARTVILPPVNSDSVSPLVYESVDRLRWMIHDRITYRSRTFCDPQGTVQHAVRRLRALNSDD